MIAWNLFFISSDWDSPKAIPRPLIMASFGSLIFKSVKFEKLFPTFSYGWFKHIRQLTLLFQPCYLMH